jgi:hypothetical protein
MKNHWLKHTLIVSSPNLDILTIASAQKFIVLERPKITNSMEIATKVRATYDEHVYISVIYTFGVAPSSANASSKSLLVDWNCICIVN